jgi:hypothetical protein
MNKTIRKKEPEGEPAKVWFEFDQKSDLIKMKWFEDDGINIHAESFETCSACRSRIDELIIKFDDKRKMFEIAKTKLNKRIEEDEELKKLGRSSN